MADIGSIIQAVAACVNLVFVVFFFLVEGNNRKEDRRLMVKSHWFADFIYEKNISLVEAFFETEMNLIKTNLDGLNGNLTLNEIKKIKQEILYETWDDIDKFQSKFISLIEVIDEQFSQILYDQLLTYQDKLAAEFESLEHQKIQKNCYGTILNSRLEFLKSLYNYNLSLKVENRRNLLSTLKTIVKDLKRSENSNH